MKASKCKTCRNLESRSTKHVVTGEAIKLTGKCLKLHSPRIYKDGMKRICDDYLPNLIRIM